MQKPKYKDYPFYEVAKAADQLIAQGCAVYQKFTCSGCGARLSMDEPNVFHKMGTCDKCPAVTNIEKQGCNYMVVTGA
jgi:hypothetical protein